MNEGRRKRCHGTRRTKQHHAKGRRNRVNEYAHHADSEQKRHERRHEHARQRGYERKLREGIDRYWKRCHRCRERRREQLAELLEAPSHHKAQPRVDKWCERDEAEDRQHRELKPEREDDLRRGKRHHEDAGEQRRQDMGTSERDSCEKSDDAHDTGAHGRCGKARERDVAYEQHRQHGAPSGAGRAEACDEPARKRRHDREVRP